MIRELEKQHGPPLPRCNHLRPRTNTRRLSFVEQRLCGFLMEIGFDGWLLKPINFRRLGVIDQDPDNNTWQ